MNRHQVIEWTDERVELLRTRWPTHSSELIAREIGGLCTRNAVIGKAHRMGLTKSAVVRRVNPAKPRATKKLADGAGI